MIFDGDESEKFKQPEVKHEDEDCVEFRMYECRNPGCFVEIDDFKCKKTRIKSFKWNDTRPKNVNSFLN